MIRIARGLSVESGGVVRTVPQKSACKLKSRSIDNSNSTAKTPTTGSKSLIPRVELGYMYSMYAN